MRQKLACLPLYPDRTTTLQDLFSVWSEGCASPEIWNETEEEKNPLSSKGLWDYHTNGLRVKTLQALKMGVIFLTFASNFFFFAVGRDRDRKTNKCWLFLPSTFPRLLRFVARRTLLSKLGKTSINTEKKCRMEFSLRTEMRKFYNDYYTYCFCFFFKVNVGLLKWMQFKVCVFFNHNRLKDKTKNCVCICGCVFACYQRASSC